MVSKSAWLQSTWPSLYAAPWKQCNTWAFHSAVCSISQIMIKPGYIGDFVLINDLICSSRSYEAHLLLPLFRSGESWGVDICLGLSGGAVKPVFKSTLPNFKAWDFSATWCHLPHDNSLPQRAREEKWLKQRNKVSLRKFMVTWCFKCEAKGRRKPASLSLASALAGWGFT